MRRAVITLVGLAILAGAAIFIARHLLKPQAEKVERSAPVLTGAYDVQLAECRILEDHELPEGVTPPAVGENIFYVSVIALYPGRENAPEAGKHYLDRINGDEDRLLRPVHASSDITDEGQFAMLVFRTPDDFEFGRLMLEEKVVLDKVILE
ncbi:MAG: hypothetical protein HC813_02710 [Planctomycetes bacterium]|nr:hypothetical protein [Planctomycetota bacterium]